MESLNQHRFSFRAFWACLFILFFLTNPVFAADGTIDVLPDENADGSVELTPGYIAGIVDIGGQAVNRIDLEAQGGDYSAKASLPAEGAYELTVNVPQGGSLAYSVDGIAFMDGFNTRLYFQNRPTVVEEAKTSVVDIIIDAGHIIGTITTEGCTISQGEVWAVLDDGNRFSKAYTKFDSTGTFRLPIQPNTDIHIYGQVQLSGGAAYQLESKYITVTPGTDTPVGWQLLCGPGEPGAIDHHVDYHMEIDHHYSYLYYQNSWSPYRSIKHPGDVLFDNIAPGDWRLYTYTYWNNRRNLIAKHMDGISVGPGETVQVDIDTDPGFLQGNITLQGTHTLADTTAAYIYAHGRNAAYPSNQTTSRAFVESRDGAFNLALPHGEWEVFNSIFYFNHPDPNDEHLKSYLYMYDYKLRQTRPFMEAGQTITGHDLTYETGSATIQYSRSDGGAFTRPYANAKCYIREADGSLQEYHYVLAHGAPDGDTVTFVGFPGTYEVEAWAYVNRSQTTFGKVTIEIVPGVDKVVDIGGPQLVVQSPAPSAVTEETAILVTGVATDDSGVKYVLVNGEPAELISTNNPEDENEVAFSVEIELSEGENRIVTEAMDFSGNASSDTRSVTHTVPELVSAEVLVDIKPGSCKNPLNIKSQGVLPVVIIGGEGFDINAIDPASITLMGVSPLRWVVDDVASLNGGYQPSAQSKCDTDMPDGQEDLVLKFDTQEIVAALGDAADGDIVALPLAGMLEDGTDVTGSDTVTLLKKGNQQTGKKKK